MNSSTLYFRRTTFSAEGRRVRGSDFRIARLHTCLGYALIALAIGAASLAVHPEALADSPEPLHCQIDRIIASSIDVSAMRPANDAEFLRRVTLDLTGQVPSATETREFLGVHSNDKRTVLIERLLICDDYSRHWAQVLDAWLMQRRPGRNVPQTQWQEYLRDSISANKPWDQLAIEILSADGADPATRAPARFFLDRESNTEELVRDIGSIFLGRDLRCAQCHDHPIVPEYRQAHFFGLAAFVDRSFLFDDKDHKQKVLAEKSEGQTAFTSALTQVKGVAMPQVFDEPPLIGPAIDVAVAIKPPRNDGIRPVPAFSRRALLPLAVVQHPAFSRNLANRLWAVLFGRGIVDPVDQDHAGNPASHPQLLQLLSTRLVELNYDIRGVVRELVLTDVYQQSTVMAGPNGQSVPPLPFVQPLRKLTPEQLGFSWLRATGRRNLELQSLMGDLKTGDPRMIDIMRVSPSTKQSIIHERLAAQVDKVVKVFVTSLPGEVSRSDSTAGQALFLMNGETLRDWIAQVPGNLLDQLAHQPNNEQVADELYLATLSRRPEASEVRWVVETLQSSEQNRVAAISDLIESLLTSVEFRFNH